MSESEMIQTNIDKLKLRIQILILEINKLDESALICLHQKNDYGGECYYRHCNEICERQLLRELEIDITSWIKKQNYIDTKIIENIIDKSNFNVDKKKNNIECLNDKMNFLKKIESFLKDELEKFDNSMDKCVRCDEDGYCYQLMMNSLLYRVNYSTEKWILKNYNS